MGDMQMSAAQPVGGGRHEFTQEERERGQRTSASRARRQRVIDRQRFREWTGRDARLWNDLQDALQYGTDREVSVARSAWSEHQASMPVSGRRG